MTVARKRTVWPMHAAISSALKAAIPLLHLRVNSQGAAASTLRWGCLHHKVGTFV